MLKAIPDTFILFVLTLVLIAVYVLLIQMGHPDDTIKTLLIACAGGLIALLTSRKGSGNIEANVEHVDMHTDAPQGDK
jgi:Na+/H+ antiporter NhaD/arsenite permease-like protein